MNISLEISMYPLAADYVPQIEAFIDDLKTRAGIEVKTNAMSTQVFGDLDIVMGAIREGLRESWSADEKSIFVMKLINSDLRN